MTSAVERNVYNQFGFLAKTSLTPAHNARNFLAGMPGWLYFTKPSHLAFHNLSFQDNLIQQIRKMLIVKDS